MDTVVSSGPPSPILSDRLRILMIAAGLPTPNRPGSMAPVARQVDSLRSIGVRVGVQEVAGGRGVRYALAMRDLWRRVGQVDLVHAHYGYCGWVARTQFRRPVVVSFMGDDLLGTPDRGGRVTLASHAAILINKRVARMADAVIVKSVEMANVLAPLPSYVVPNGVDLTMFRPMPASDARRALGWSDGQKYALFPGSPKTPRKGHPLARATVTAAAAMMDQPIQLVTLDGVPPQDVPLYMNACDVVLLTSLWEGSPNVVKEALACDRPVVSVPVGDVADLLRDVDGSAVCPRVPDQLGAALVGVLRSVRRSDGREALRRRGLDLESVAWQLTDIYATVLDRNVRDASHSRRPPASGVARGSRSTRDCAAPG
jgi:glycosyltransferase involved in cell wall biosynthesis